MNAVHPKPSFLFLALALLALTLPTPALAAPITFDFTRPTGRIITPANQPLVFTAGGESVSVTAHDHSGGSGADVPFGSVGPAGIHQNRTGLGVLYASSFSVDDSGQLDGSGVSEHMVLDFSSFSTPVRLLNVVLGAAVGTDEFDLGIDDQAYNIDANLGNNEIINVGVPLGAATPANADYLVDFTNAPIAPIGRIFTFTTDDVGDSYRVTSITVEATKPVPEPATLSLLGLAGLLGLRLRRQ